jgi:large subunit ribosomal protein L10
MFEGPTAITFVKGDAVIAAKALRDFGKTNAALIVKGGLLGTKVLVPAEIAALADVAPRDVLLAMLAGGFQAPMVKAAGLFQAFTRNMAFGVKALIDQRIAGGEAAPVEEAPTADAPAEEVAAAEEAPAEEAPAVAAPDGDAPAAADDATPSASED